MKKFLINRILELKKQYSIEPKQSVLLEYGTYNVYLYTLNIDQLRNEYIDILHENQTAITNLNFYQNES